MLVPQRCFTCGRVISNHWNEFKERAREGDEDPAQVLDDLGLDRYCCRSIFVTHVDLMDDVAAFTKR